MHPPHFSPAHRLSDWPDCTLEAHCRNGRVVTYPLRLLAQRHGDRSFRTVLALLH